MRVLVTGGAGFIGSHFVRRLAAAGDEVVVLDKLTYAGNPENLAGVEHEFHQGDIADPEAVTAAARGCDAIVNFAAESHVDRSILDGADFLRTNVIGTNVLLAAAREAGVRMLQVSTDEVYGDLPPGRSSHRGRPDPAVEPVLGRQGERRPVRARARPHPRRRCADHPRLEHLRAEPVPGEDPAALRHERARRRAAAALRRRQAGARLAARRGPLRRDRARAARGPGRARSTTSAGAPRSRISRSPTACSS